MDTDTPYLMVGGGGYTPYVELPRHGHEVFPPLADYVAQNYSLVFESPIDETGYKLRVYERN